MNWLQLQNTLYAAGRRNPPGDQVPYAFEKRVMAGLRAVPPADAWAACARGLWYGAGVCAAVTLLISVWTHTPFSGQADQTFSFAEDLEQSILASSGDSDGNWW